MPDIQRIITIATQGANSGPYYDVYWSNNCSTYTLATDGSNVYLPSVGSSVFVTMPDTACCIKLVNLSEGCFLNEVVLNFCPTTSTTLAPTTTTTISPTTTLAPTTTTTLAPTTTTIAPTTTTTLTPTTTTTQCPCVESVTLNVTTAGTFEFTDCCGTPRQTSVPQNSSYLVDYSTDGCININTFGGTAEYTVVSYGACCTPVCPTTTTTIAPTTTTTLTPTTTTTQPQFIQVEVCGGGDGPYIVTRGSGDIPAGTGQAFKLSGSYAGFNGITCWEVLDSAASGPADYTNVAFGNVFNNCAACVPTTTTLAPTTTTTLAPTTTTTQPQFIQVELCGGGDGPYIITRGSGDSPSGIGQAFKLTGSYSGFNGIDCWEVLDSAASGPADYTNVGFGSVFSSCAACVPTTTTLSPTTTTLSPTTTTIAPTTTTLSPTTTTIAPTTSTTTTPPTIYSVEPCGGGQGPYKITYGTGDLPSGVGQAFKLNNGGTPFNGVDCWEILEYPVAGPADYEAVAFGSVFSNCAACVPTTTTIAPTTTTVAPTTTTTTASPTTTTTVSRLLDWSYTLSGGATGVMDIYINSTAVETRNSNSSGTWPLSVGDVIYFEVYTTSCSGGNDTANSYTLVPGVPSYAVLADAACTNGVGTITLTTGTYTVQSSDGTIYVDAFSTCDAGCV